MIIVLLGYVNYFETSTLNLHKSPLSDNDVTLQLFVCLERAVLSSKSLHEYISVVHQELQKIFDAENMTVMLFTEQSSSLFCEYYRDVQQQEWHEGQLIAPSELSASPISYVLDTQTGLCLKRGRKSSEWRGSIKGNCWMAFPLMSTNQECLGAVSVYNYAETAHYSSQEYALMQLIASRICNAIEQFNLSMQVISAKYHKTALLERELREKDKAEKLQRALYQIATLVTQELELSELYQHVHKVVAELLYAKNFFIAMLDDEQKHLTFSYFVDQKDGYETKFKTVDVGRGLTSYVVKTKSSQLLTAQDVKRLIALDEIDEVLGSAEFSCWMGAPLVSNNKVHGIIVLQSYDDNFVFDEADLQLLNFVATHVATAIELSVAAQIKRNNQRQLELHHKEISETLVQLKITQKELIQKEKMASLGSLVAGIAHEINTPLGICVTGVSHLAEEYRLVKKPFDDNSLTKSGLVDFFESVEESTTILTNNINRAAELVQSFKQVAVDQSADHIRQFTLASYIDEIILAMGRTLKNHDHKVLVNCDPNIVVNVNAGAISQVLTNLMANSVIHGFENMLSGEIVIDVSEKDGQILLKYKDSGKGVSKENMEKLFEPFFTTKRGRGGNGLGTHVVYNLVTSALHGTVQADSPLGQGLHYFIRFPSDSELVQW